jgi:hypothetical protein
MVRQVTPRKRWDPTGRGFVARETTIEFAGSHLVALKAPDATLEVYNDGGYSILYNSRAMIEDYMTLDEALTDEIQEDFENTYDRGGYIEWMKDWLGKRGWRVSSLGADNTYNWDSTYYWGEVFEYVHFETDDGNEGALIMWHLGGDPRGGYAAPEVWMGGFEEFVGLQEEGDPSSVDTLRWVDERFEGGIAWALRYFEAEGMLDLREGPALEFFEAMEAERIRAEEEEERRRRREIERRLGQRYLWPEMGP